MRMMMKVSMPVEPANKGLQDGTLPKTLMGFIDQYKPEAAYFFAEDGRRTGLFFFDLKDVSLIPMIVEPFFTNISAAVWVKPVMNAAELKIGLEKLGGKR